MDVRPLTADLAAPLEEFFRRVPESDHNSFAEDVFEPGRMASWLSGSRAHRAVAVSSDEGGERGDSVLGYVAVLPLVGWSSHVGNLRVVVDPAARGKGVGRALSRHGLMAGLELGLTKLVVEVVVDAVPAIGMFEDLGFEPEALLRDHVRDKGGELHDLVVLAHLVEGTWEGLAAAGIEDEMPA